MTYSEQQLQQATDYAEDACRRKADSTGHAQGSTDWQAEYERCVELIPRYTMEDDSTNHILEWADSILYELSAV